MYLSVIMEMVIMKYIKILQFFSKLLFVRICITQHIVQSKLYEDVIFHDGYQSDNYRYMYI